AEDDPEGAGRGQREAGHVEAAVWTVALAQLAGGERDQQDADGDVDPEDPVPGDGLHDGAADERADGDRDAADARPDADRHPAALGGEGLGQEGQGQRGDDGRSRALQSAGGDEQAGGGRERRGGGGGG